MDVQLPKHPFSIDVRRQFIAQALRQCDDFLNRCINRPLFQNNLFALAHGWIHDTFFIIFVSSGDRSRRLGNPKRPFAIGKANASLGNQHGARPGSVPQQIAVVLREVAKYQVRRVRCEVGLPGNPVNSIEDIAALKVSSVTFEFEFQMLLVHAQIRTAPSAG